METKKSKSLLVRLFAVLAVLCCCLSLVFGLAGCGEEVKGIKSTMINDKGELIVTYTDDSTANLGVVVGKDGATGAPGAPGAPGDDRVGLADECSATEDGEHVIVQTVVKYANCAEEGLAIEACTACRSFEYVALDKEEDVHGKIVNYVVPCPGHDGVAIDVKVFEAYKVNNGENYVAPTCTAAGQADSICSGCGATLNTDIIDALGHTHLYFEGALADGNVCEDGLFKGYVCTTCGEVYNNTEDATDAKNPVYEAPKNAGQHTADNTWTYVNDVKPSLTAGAQITGICTECKETKVIDIPALTDSRYNVTNTAASCTVASKTTYSANFNGFDVVVDIEGSVVHTVLVGGVRTTVDLSKTYSVDEALELGMRIVNNAQLPTCQDIGSATFYCVDCSGAEYAFMVSVKGSCEIDTTIAGVVTAPTCTTKGYTTYVCKVCGEDIVKDYKDEIPHTYKLVGREGLTLTFECSMCGDEVVIANAVKNDQKSKDAKCNEDGLEVYDYTDPNGDPQEFENVIPATGLHNIAGSSIVLDLTKTYAYSEIESLIGNGLRFVNDEAPASCLEAGNAVFACEHCSTNNDVLMISVYADHKFTADPDKVTAPTCQADGYTTKYCSVCERDIVVATEDKIECDFEFLKGEEVNGALTITFKCSMCGDEKTINNAVLNTLESEAPTCSEKGKNVYDYIDLDGQPAKFPVDVDPTGLHKIAGFDMQIDLTKTYAYSEIDDMIGNGLRFVNDQAPASCHEAGNAVFACEYCSTNNDVLMISVYADHKLGAVETKAPTCHEGGYQYQVCSTCPEADKIHVIAGSEVSANGCTYGQPEFNEETAEFTFTCSVCDETCECGGKLVITPSADDIDDSNKPTCTTDGSIKYYYGDGATDFVEVVVPATGHAGTEDADSIALSWQMEIDGVLYDITGYVCPDCETAVILTKTPVEAE